MTYQKGDKVARRSIASEVGIVVNGPRELRGQTWYKVFFDGRTESMLAEDLRPVGDRKSTKQLFIQGAFGDEKSFSRLLTLAKINEPVRNTIYSYQASRTELHGYQYKPLLKYLNSPYRRILIADEVGLGKTIEAAYIFQEERARQDLQRVLIVCPASLRVKWQNEMSQRFGERFEILRASEVRRRLSSQNEHDLLYQRLYGIVSYATIRSKQLRELLDQYPPNLDFLIVDEVHHCRNRDTHNFRSVRLLTENSDSAIFLSATPIHTGNKNLFNLMNLILPERFDVEEAFIGQLAANKHIVRAESLICRGTKEAIRQTKKELDLLKQHPAGHSVTTDPFYPLVIENLESEELVSNTEMLVETQEMISKLNLLADVLTRTRKREVEEDSAVRVAYSPHPVLTEYEQFVYDMLSEFIFEQYQCQYDSSIARFVLVSLQKLIASSLYSAVLHYKQQFEQVTELAGKEPLDLLEIEESDFGLDTDEDEESPKYSLLKDDKFHEIILSIQLDKLREEDTKYEAFKKLLPKDRKVIVFAFYKRSLRYLQERLEQEGIYAVRIDGDVPTNPEDPLNDERLLRIRTFRNDPNCKVLLSSQVGSEGLDFQFCDTIVNWDLPWNPMVVEQRIGRIDRLGQQSDKIFIFNIVSCGTIEERVIERLYNRIGIFKDSIGDLEPILGEIIREITEDLFNPNFSIEEKEKQFIQKTNALFRERKNLRRLEKNSAQLIAHDEIIQQKIKKISDLGRYLTGKELEIFVAQFLSRKFPTNELYNDNGRTAIPGEPGARYMNVSHELRQFLAERVLRTDQEGQRFLRLMGHNKMKLVFEAKSAMAHLDAELIHAHHPFIKVIASFYEENPETIHRVNLLQVSSDTLNPGVYFYGWASIDERGTFHGRYLRMMLLSFPDAIPVTDTEKCERLLHEMVINGSAWQGDHPELSLEVSEDFYNWLDENISEFVSIYRLKRNREAEATVHRQIQSIEASYQVKRRRREKAIETIMKAGRSERMIRLNEEQIKKLEADFEMKQAELLARKGVDVSYRIDGMGFVKINPLPNLA